MPTVQLTLPAVTQVNFAVASLAGSIGNYEVIGEPIFHSAGEVNLVHINCVVDGGG